MHCRFCGNTNLKTIQDKIFREPIFVTVHTLFALLVVYWYFVPDPASFSGLGMLSVFFYVISLAYFFMFWNKNSNYFCKDCGTLTEAETNVEVAEYDTVPKKNDITQRKGLKQRHLKEVIMIAGSIGSVAGFILVLMPK